MKKHLKAFCTLVFSRLDITEVRDEIRILLADENVTVREIEIRQPSLVDLGLDKKPICVAKTQYSLSDNPSLLGRPSGFKVNVAEGAQVKKGQCVAILEAMKLENEIVATADGVVKQVLVSKGQSVNNQQDLLIIG